MFATTQAIVLQLNKYQDNKYLVRLLTREYGCHTYSVYAPQSKRAAVRLPMLQPGQVLEVEVEHLPKREVQRLREVHPACVWNSILRHPEKRSICFFMAEVLHRSLYVGGACDLPLYDFALASFRQLDACEHAGGMFPLHFLLDLSLYLGLYPEDGADNDFLQALQEEERYLFLQLLTEREKGLFPHKERRRLTDLLLRYYQWQLPGMSSLKSLSVLQSLYE